MEHYKEFYCKQCSVRFRIIVETSCDPLRVEENLPESVAWLGKVRMCPVCEDDIAIEKKSPDEAMTLREALIRGICPDCREDKWLKGPEGGCSVNIECAKCGSRFNVCPPYFFERIERS